MYCKKSIKEVYKFSMNNKEKEGDFYKHCVKNTSDATFAVIPNL